MAGLLVICFQKAHAINLLKNECLEKGFEVCRTRMYENRYQHNDLFAYIIICLNIPSIITFFIGQVYRAKWINIKLSNYDSISNKGNLCEQVDGFFFVQLFLLMLSPIPGHKYVFKTELIPGKESSDEPYTGKT